MTSILFLLALPIVALRRCLDWSTLTYSPSRMASDDAYAAAWTGRRCAAKRLPIVGCFMRAWEDADADPAWVRAKTGRGKVGR